MLRLRATLAMHPSAPWVALTGLPKARGIIVDAFAHVHMY